MPLSKKPIYNLKAVLKETGLKADVLRAWERRYGLPAPERTQGGHRLYSQLDIETIKWLIARQNDGFSISRAVEHWRELEASSRDPFADYPQTDVSTPIAFSGSSTSLEALRAEWLKACLAFNEASAEQALNQAFGLYSVEAVCTELLQRGLYEIGELWYRGDTSVQQEHFASGLAMRRLDTLLSAAPTPFRTETILTACPVDEWHVFPLLILTLFLRRRGWNVVSLGANVPVERLEEAVAVIRPQLVILAAQQLTSAASLSEMAHLLNKKGIQTLYGGRVFNLIPEIRPHIPAIFLGTLLETATQSIETLVVNPTRLQYEPVPKKFQRIVQEYKQKRAFIETQLLEDFQTHGQLTEYLDIANFFLGNTLTAALSLGNISYIASDIDWLRSLLNQHRVPTSLLPVYLALYAESAQKIMGSDGQLITDSLEIYRLKILQGLSVRTN